MFIYLLTYLLTFFVLCVVLYGGVTVSIITLSVDVATVCSQWRLRGDAASTAFTLWSTMSRGAVQHADIPPLQSITVDCEVTLSDQLLARSEHGELYVNVSGSRIRVDAKRTSTSTYIVCPPGFVPSVDRQLCGENLAQTSSPLLNVLRPPTILRAHVSSRSRVYCETVTKYSL